MSKNTADPNAIANTLRIAHREGRTDDQLMTELAMSSVVRNTLNAKSYANPSFSGDPPQLEAAIEITSETCADVRAGNFERLIDMLTAQAIALDNVFTEYSRRSLLNAGEYLSAAETYANLAAKAQANCRATIEALAKIKRAGKQTVKVIHVHEGAQAVVADTINQGGLSGKSIKQPHAKAPDAPVASLPSANETSKAMPLACDAERSMSHARRDKPRRAAGE